MANVNWSWKPPKGYKAPAKLPDAPIPCEGNPRTSVPHYEAKTERVEAGGHARGPGANVSDVLRGYNNAHDKVMQAIGGRVNAHFKAKRQAKRAARIERRKAMGLL